MRSFIGIDFGSDLKRHMADLQRDLRSQALSGRWKYIDNFHLTLKFLGEIDHQQVQKIDEILSKISEHTGSFQLKISELGSFPGRESLRVLWLGLGGDLEVLYRLQAEIEDTLVVLGFKKEARKYTPHITIGQDIVFRQEFGRIRELVDIGALPEVRVKSLHLFKSEQIANKRIYSSIAEHKLM